MKGNIFIIIFHSIFILEHSEPAETAEVTAIWSNRVARALQMERSGKDWLVYSLAVQYWRIKGNPQKAVECARKALYFVPRSALIDQWFLTWVRLNLSGSASWFQAFISLVHPTTLMTHI